MKKTRGIFQKKYPKAAKLITTAREMEVPCQPATHLQLSDACAAHMYWLDLGLRSPGIPMER